VRRTRVLVLYGGRVLGEGGVLWHLVTSVSFAGPRPRPGPEGTSRLDLTERNGLAMDRPSGFNSSREQLRSLLY
jgi:hypothetical protein